MSVNPSSESNRDFDANSIQPSLEQIRGEITRISEGIKGAVAQQLIGDATYALEKLAKANEELRYAVEAIGKDCRDKTFDPSLLKQNLESLRNGRTLAERLSALICISKVSSNEVRWVGLDELIQKLRGESTTAGGYNRRYNPVNVKSCCKRLAQLGFVEIHGIGKSAKMRPSQLTIDLLRDGNLGDILDIGTTNSKSTDSD